MCARVHTDVYVEQHRQLGLAYGLWPLPSAASLAWIEPGPRHLEQHCWLGLGQGQGQGTLSSIVSLDWRYGTLAQLPSASVCTTFRMTACTSARVRVRTCVLAWRACVFVSVRACVRACMHACVYLFVRAFVHA